MDPYSAEGELINLHNHFHQGQYRSVLTPDTSTLSPSNVLPAQILVLRAGIALGEYETVLKQTRGRTEVEMRAVGAFAEYRSGKTESAVAKVEELVGDPEGEGARNETVLVVAGSVFAAEGRAEEALAVLGRHEGSLEAVALIVQVYLGQNRNDLAVREVAAARRWAQDSLLVNLAESWVGLRLGGDKYQQAFYVFEELAQTSSTTSVRSLVSQAVAELHLGRLEEAQAALEQAMKKEPEFAEAIANMLVLTVISGKDPKELINTLKKVAPKHQFLTDLEEKSALFDKAAAKYSAAKAG